jgi:hypothetical protein
MRDYYEVNKVSFKVFYKNGEERLNLKEVACFHGLPRDKEYKKIVINKILCVHTKHFAKDYIRFINEIHPIVLRRNTVTFNTTGNRAKDLAICSMVRMLWEENDINLDLFFNTLLFDLKKVKDPIKRFIKAYNTKYIIGRYTGCGHAFGYNLNYKLRLKSLEKFKKADNINNIYDFFSSVTTRRIFNDY